jgi:hypothetical protein
MLKFLEFAEQISAASWAIPRDNSQHRARALAKSISHIVANSRQHAELAPAGRTADPVHGNIAP